LRWYRLSDGQELLALFVHKVDRRWVTWTPSGYYMASPGAEAMIGWHVNRGRDEAAQFYPADRFRNQFYRPDIVKLVLDTLDERAAIDVANQRSNVKPALEDVRKIAPPIVVIQTPADSTTFRTPEVTIAYEVFAPSGDKVAKVEYFVNGRAVADRGPSKEVSTDIPTRYSGSFPSLDRGSIATKKSPRKAATSERPSGASDPPADSGKFVYSGRVTLSLPPEDVTVCLVAYVNQAGEPACIRLRWDGPSPGLLPLPRLRGLFVGVSAYTSPKLARLAYAAKDASDLAAFFRAQGGKSYGKVETRLLTDARRRDVLDGLEWLHQGSEEGDVNLLFLAGHGATLEQTFYFMAADSDPDMLRATAVSRDEIQRAIRLRKGMMIVLLDVSRSGGGIDAAGPSPVDVNRTTNELGDRSLGVLLYASTSGRQYSYERAEWGNGAFTRALIEGLQGAADFNKDGAVETDELALYIRSRVAELTKGQQTPVRVKPDAAAEMKIVLLK
jgi:hypothetical protein